MKIAILSRSKRLYSTDRIFRAAEARGHAVEVINPLKCYMKIAPHHPEIHYQGRKLEGFDAVIPRIGNSITRYGCAVLRQFEMNSIYTLNDSQAIVRSRDKLRTMQLLARRGIGLPTTGFAHSPGDTTDMLNLIGSAPVVIKLVEGTHGKGVVKADTPQTAQSIMDAFGNLGEYFLIQEFIKESSGTDIRAFVVGNRVVAAMQRRATKEGEFRSNIHLGGVGEEIELTPEERSTATRAAKAMKLSVAGVDLIRSNHGSVVLEVNSSPGLEGIEGATGVDVAGAIIEFIERRKARGTKQAKE